MPGAAGTIPAQFRHPVLAGLSSDARASGSPVPRCRIRPRARPCNRPSSIRPTKVEHWLAHLVNSRRTFLRLVQKARTFDEKQAQALIKDRNYAALDQMVLEHLMGK